jgi:hypothetical protein
MRRIFRLRTLAILSALALLGYGGFVAMNYLYPKPKEVVPPAVSAKAPVPHARPKAPVTEASAVAGKEKKRSGSAAAKDKKTAAQKKNPA